MPLGSASIDDQGDRAITWVDDHDLLVGHQEPVIAQFGYAVQNDRRQLVQLYIIRVWIGVEYLTGWAWDRRSIIDRLRHRRMPPLVAEGASRDDDRGDDRKDPPRALGRG
jgi:hypothetical protein